MRVPLVVGAVAVGVVAGGVVAAVLVRSGGGSASRRGPTAHAGGQTRREAVVYSSHEVGRWGRQLHARGLRARLAAAQALARMGPRAAEAVPDLLAAMARRSAEIEFRMALGRAVRAMGSSAVPYLVAALGSEAPRTRFDAAQALAKLGPEARGALEPLIEVVERDRDYSVRACAAAALGAIGPPAAAALPALRRAAGNPNEPLTHDAPRSELRVRARMAIDQITDPSRK